MKVKKQKMTLERLAFAIKGDFTNLEGKIDGLEGKIDGLEGRIDKLETSFICFKNETEKNFGDINSTIFLFKNDMSGHMDHIYKKLEDLETENLAGSASYKRYDKAIAGHESRILKLEKTAK